MIKFEGKITSEGAKKRGLRTILIAILVGGCFQVGIMAFVFFVGLFTEFYKILFCVASFLFLLIVIIICFYKANASLPISIVIDEENVDGTYEEEEFTTRKTEHIKHILDYGDFYIIKFYFPNHWVDCICQKDLILEGTIEEFEQMFEDKIIRKIKTAKK